MARIAAKKIIILFILLFTVEAAAFEPVDRLPFKPRWVTILKKGTLLKYKRREFASPGAYQDWIFAGSDTGYFYALKKKNGDKAWRVNLHGIVDATPAFWNNLVFIGDDKGVLHALSVKEGKEVWKQSLESEIFAQPTILGNHVFITTADGIVAAFNAADGTPIWAQGHQLQPFHMTIMGTSPAVVDSETGRLYIGFADGVLWSLNAADGKLIWEKSFANKKRGFQDIDGAPVLDKDRFYISTFDGSVFAIDKKDGKILWNQEIGSGVRMLAQDDTLFIAGSDGYLYSLDRKDGSTNWKAKVVKGALTAPLLYGRVVMVGASEDTMNFLDATTGRTIMRRFARKGVYSDPILDTDDKGITRIYYLSNGGRLYSLQLVDPFAKKGHKKQRD